MDAARKVRVRARRHAFSALRGYRRVLGGSGIDEATLARLDRVAQGILEAHLKVTTQYAVRIGDRDLCVGQYRPWGTDDLGRPRGWVQHLVIPLEAVRRIAFFHPLDLSGDCFPDPPESSGMQSLAEVVDLDLSEAHFRTGFEQASPAPLSREEIESLLSHGVPAGTRPATGTARVAGGTALPDPVRGGREAYRGIVGLSYLLPRSQRLRVVARPSIVGENPAADDCWRWLPATERESPVPGPPPEGSVSAARSTSPLARWIADPRRRERLRCFLLVLERREQDEDLVALLARVDAIENEEAKGTHSRAASEGPTVESLRLANALDRHPGLEDFARQLIQSSLRDLERNPDLRVLTAALDALEEIAEESLLRDRPLEHVMPRGWRFLREVGRSLREGRYGSSPGSPLIRRLLARIDRLRANLG